MYVPSRIASKQLGVHPKTLRIWADSGRIPSIKDPSGQRRYDIDAFLRSTKSRRSICYCRVSSSKQKDDLERQIAFLKTRYPNHEIIHDIGSGINFKRKGLNALLESICSGDVEEVVVAHKDRLARFGFELIQWIATKHSTRLLVLDNTSLSPEQELTQDLLSIVHIFSCRLHGLRSYSKTIKKDKDLPQRNPKSNLETMDGDISEVL